MISRISKIGCNGRSDKLVDACYAFYLTASIILVEFFAGFTTDKSTFKPIVDFLIIFCQTSTINYVEGKWTLGKDEGGFSDRSPNKPDVYHTCYSISALSLLKNYYKFVEIPSINCCDPILNVPLDISIKHMNGPNQNDNLYDEFIIWFSNKTK